ncbi:MAG: hypothetical protein AVDCRST_MAG67-3556 [uncultured Solirubrobacteraceae bacterium]|uniref:Uncharacterized protein n=1 Tax=uncultured Solirubrobacteraceae bacterium TaxID=1162706 RepID=A0A6J4TJK8_9ACTN|nr:MAG: hypothetical protein AVDCRST_MAG67-3556 [uncultured Solirubrobacteraceae bacterium]
MTDRTRRHGSPTSRPARRDGSASEAMRRPAVHIEVLREM